MDGHARPDGNAKRLKRIVCRIRGFEVLHESQSANESDGDSSDSTETCLNLVGSTKVQGDSTLVLGVGLCSVLGQVTKGITRQESVNNVKDSTSGQENVALQDLGAATVGAKGKGTSRV